MAAWVVIVGFAWFWGAHGAVVTDLDACRKVGAPRAEETVVRCTWNKNVLEDRFMENICEPSQDFMNTSRIFSVEEMDFCPDQSLAKCWYDDETKCLLDNTLEEGEEISCYTPPLQFLKNYLMDLLQSFVALHEWVDVIPRRCSSKVNNESCLSEDECIWVVQNESQVREVNYAADDTQVQEVQSISVFPFDTSVQEQKHNATLEPPLYDGRIVTLTLSDVDVNNIVSGSFQLVFDDKKTNFITAVDRSANAPTLNTANTIKTELSKLTPTLVDVQVGTYQDGKEPTSWVLTFSTASNANKLSLGVTSFDNKSGTQGGNSSPPLVLTRHHHNKQILNLYSNGPVTAGEFVLRYTKPNVQTANEPVVVDTASKALPFNATASQVRQALLGLKVGNNRLIEFVSVKAIDYGTGDPFGQGPTMEPQLWRSWNITFVTDLDTYEYGEFQLQPLWASNGCSTCKPFQISFTNVTAKYNMDVVSINIGPKMNGFFTVERCSFLSVLQGLAYPNVGSKVVQLDYDLDPSILVQPGDYVRIAGRVFVVESATEKTIVLDHPFTEHILPNTINGSRVYTCQYQRSSALSILISGPALANALETEFPDLGNVNIATGTRGLLNQQYWSLTFTSPLNEVDPIRFVSATGTNQLLSSGSKFVMKKPILGRAALSGSFRLAFAGYDGSEDMYGQFFRSRLQVNNPRAPSGGVLSLNNRRISYTAPISIDASPQELETAFNRLDNFVKDGVTVEKRNTTYMPPGSTSPLKGVEWVLTFFTNTNEILHLVDVNRIDTLTANIPQLAVADASLLSGTGAQVMIKTLRQGNGTLLNNTVTVEVAVDPRNSPCTVDSNLRDESIRELGIREDKIFALQQLDANFQRCAGGLTPNSEWNNAEDCAKVQFSKSLDGGAQVNEDVANANSSFCVWRGKDRLENITQSALQVDLETVYRFNWDNSTYDGRTGLSQHANCTVPLIYKSQQLLKLFSLTNEFIIEYEKQNRTDNDTQIDIDLNRERSAQLSGFIDQFNECFEDQSATIEVPAPKFIKLWQEIVTFTCYTTGLVYGVAGFFFTYRMRTFKLLSPKAIGSAILIVLFSVVLGGIIGFVIGAIPAAIIFNIYNAIPHNLPFASAISLGVAQGLLILYFDSGRGLRTSP